jgi:chromatin structure-remodeling complex subunit RSC1/2
MCDIFRELPDREEWADYYEAIIDPECLDNVAVSDVRAADMSA